MGEKELKELIKLLKEADKERNGIYRKVIMELNYILGLLQDANDKYEEGHKK